MCKILDTIIQEPVASILFHLDKAQFGSFACSQAQNEFETLVDSLQTEQIGQMRFRHQIAILKRHVFEKRGIKYGACPRDEVITLTGTLLNKQGACLGLTALYFALADVVSICIRPLLYEGHITTCHAGVAPPQRIEVSCRGAVLSEKITKKRHHAGSSQPLVLTKEQFVAVYLSNQAAFVFAKQGNLIKALETLNLAIDLFPTYYGAWINRASVLMLAGNSEGARDSLERVFNLNPKGRFRETANLLYEKLNGRANYFTNSTMLQ